MFFCVTSDSNVCAESSCHKKFGSKPGKVTYEALTCVSLGFVLLGIVWLFTIETAINPPSRGDIGKAELGETTCLIPIPLVEVSGFFFLALENPDDPWISQDLDTLFAASPNDSIHSNLSTSCWKAASLCDGSRYSNPLKTVNLASEYIYIFTTNLPVFQIYTRVQKTFTNYLVVEPLSHSFQKKCSSNCNVDLPPSFGVKINITAFETTA